jgi:DNA anti-recombination protein RmuC
MKTKHFLAMLLIALSFSSFAQEAKKHTPPTVDELASKKTKKMAKHLQLTDEQTETVHQLNLKMAEKKLAQKDEARALREEYQNELKTILSDEQIAKMESSKRHMKDKMHKRRAKRKEKMEEEL